MRARPGAGAGAGGRGGVWANLPGGFRGEPARPGPGWDRGERCGPLGPGAEVPHGTGGAAKRHHPSIPRGPRAEALRCA